MLFAFHKMCFSDPNGTGERVNNSRTFEKYRKEFKQTISNITSNLKGNLNSQYNKKWYTNRDTGECKTFSEPPKENWILGRNLFNGQFSTLQKVKKDIENKSKAENLWKLFKENNLPNISSLNKLTKVPVQTISWLFLKYIDEYKTFKYRIN